jgi:hypothetical protein
VPNTAGGVKKKNHGQNRPAASSHGPDPTGGSIIFFGGSKKFFGAWGPSGGLMRGAVGGDEYEVVADQGCQFGLLR